MAALARAGGAVVMGTGIVSVALALDGREVLSRVLLVAAAALLAALGVALVTLAVSDGTTLRESACVPGALTWIAGTDVVGARLSLLGWQRAAAALLGVAAALWLVLVPGVLRRWQRPTAGLSFLLTVATESIAVLAARVSVADHVHWLAVFALACFALGLAFYLLVLVGFERRQLVVGRGDHWIAGGALAIAALACARCAQALGGLDTLTLGTWAAAVAWLPVLVLTEAVHPRGAFDELRWSTVFPLGMYAACSFAAGRVAGVGGLTSFAQVWVWFAFVAWVIVAGATVRQAA